MSPTAARHPLGQAPRTRAGLPERSIGWREARQIAAGAGKPNGSETVDLSDALGRMLALDLHARIDVPHYASAAMDGWAVRGPAPWRVIDPWHLADAGLEPGLAVPIVTGALVPRGADAVLRSESAEVEGAPPMLRLGAHARAGEPFENQHIRPAGEEARRGDTIIRAGARLNPAHIAVAALSGHDVLDVVRRPTVRFVFTGDEVDEHGSPPPGRVRDIFAPQLPGLLSHVGARVLGHQRAHDTLSSTVTALESSLRDAQLVITTGGTGHSSADHVRDALHELGATLLFDGIAMRPGGPTILARAKNRSLIACLPGNPLAAMAGLFTVAVPIVRVLGGADVDPLVSVVADSHLEGRAATTLLVPYALVDGRAVPSARRGSAMMRGLAEADGLLEVPETGVTAGAAAWAVSLPWL
ncbi:molybdopterin molybdotransferase MoeA [Subtercola sp. YIM 133946]|uniref:molybdopterin molybdotransferase MoeA n=1 Tax=Subtercola sp. YIM 133946 TaxID=3118909 RepID=UPI002F948CC1